MSFFEDGSVGRIHGYLEIKNCKKEDIRTERDRDLCLKETENRTKLERRY